jgi:hypothetical protein
VVIASYEDEQKPQLLPLISDIYNFLAKASVSSKELSSLKTVKMGSSRSTGLQNVCDPLNHGNDAGNESLLLLGLMKSTLDS